MSNVGISEGEVKAVLLSSKRGGSGMTTHIGDAGLPGRDLAVKNLSGLLTELVSKMYAHPAGETVAPMITEFIENMNKEFFPNIWNRPKMAKRDRCLVVMSALMALHRMEEIPVEIQRSLENGVTQEEIIEISTTLAFLIGWKAASEVVLVVNEEFGDL